jgi:5-carboxyvanillate decarboxylase
MEVSTHVVRIISAGVFDQFPNLKLVLGHMGEGLPFWLHRLHTMSFAEIGNTIKKRPSDYIKENTVITTSGMAWDPILMLSHTVLGADNILFAVDYPFGSYERDSAWMDAVDLPEADKHKIYSGNAERIFSLNA